MANNGRLVLAISVRSDVISLRNPRLEAGCLLAGFVFAVCISEGLLTSLRIRLAAVYRRAYYLLLALFFSDPLYLASLSVQGQDRRMAWCVFLFPAFASAILLTLWPAARRRELASRSGRQWGCCSWPFLAMTGCIGFYLVAWVRGMQVAEWSVMLSLVATAWITSQTISLTRISAPSMWPLHFVAAIQLIRAIKRNRMCSDATCSAADPAPDKLDARKPRRVRVEREHAPLPPGVWPGLKASQGGLRQNGLTQGQVGHQLLQSRVLLR
jgi:hypothetical protein